MIQTEKILQEKRYELKNLIDRIEKAQNKELKGSLRVIRDRKHFSYYHYLPDQAGKYPVGKYISKQDDALIHALAQSDYDRKVLKWAKECLVRIEKLLAVYQDDYCADMYEKLGAGRKELVRPYELPIDLMAEKWMAIPYVGKEISEGSTCFITERGEKVRSKSEKILADCFWRKGISYKYECPLKLKDFRTVYPDFSLFSKKTRQVIYWEHLGMMDDPGYVQKAIMKIHGYEKNGIFPGKRLLLSYEINNHLDMDEVDLLIKEFMD